MSKWKMNSADFYDILNNQDCKCSYTGIELTPDNTRISHKTPLKKGGKHEANNVELVHSSIANFVRDHSRDEVFDLCKQIVEYMENHERD